jgi:hypothetical protein
VTPSVSSTTFEKPKSQKPSELDTLAVLSNPNKRREPISAHPTLPHKGTEEADREFRLSERVVCLHL